MSPEQILERWALIQPVLQKALDHSAEETSSFTWFKRLMKESRAQLWVVLDEADQPVNFTLTQWLVYDNFTNLHIVLTASVGDAKWSAYKEAHHVLEDYAKFHNAKSIEMWGRGGWEKTLPRLTGKKGEKYKKVYTVMHMELGE